MRKGFAVLLAMLCLLMCLTVSVSAEGTQYIYEETGALLTEEEILSLEQFCAETAEIYGCGIYVLTLNDYTKYHSDPYEAAEVIYRNKGFGVGENKNGILLMLSMSERDYALVCYGDIGNSVFTDSMQDYIEDAFLEPLAVNDWYGGLATYVYCCARALESFDGNIGEAYPGYYENGEYYVDMGLRLQYVYRLYAPIIIGISLVIALVVCLIMKSRMKTAKIASRAEGYIPMGGVDLRVLDSEHIRTTRRVIHHGDDDNNSSFGGGHTSVRSSGFSGRSGKF